MASAAIRDPGTDRNFEEFARLCRRYDLPEFVKQAELAPTLQPEGLPDSVYADPVDRRYPCHNAAATWVSSLYFGEKRGEYHPKTQERVEQRLRQFADYWRIAPQVSAILKQAGENRSGDLPDACYAYIFVDGDGRRTRYKPMQSPPEVKAAADWLQQYRDRLPLRDRRVVAGKILDRADALGMKLASDAVESLERQAGRGVCDPREVAEAVKQRAALASGAFQTEILKLASVVEDKPRQSLQPSALVKLAETLDDVDRALRISPQAYGSVLRRPEDVVFSVTLTKVAEDYGAALELTTGRVYDLRQLSKLAYDDLEAAFGGDFLRDANCGVDGIDTEKLAAVAATLPRPDAELFEQLLSDAGVAPLLGKAAAAEPLPPELLAQLAEIY